MCSDSEMEIEGEHYTNGVVEGSSTRIMNGTYKHEEILQPDDNSIGNGIAGTQTHIDMNTFLAVVFIYSLFSFVFMYIVAHLAFLLFPSCFVHLALSRM